MLDFSLLCPTRGRPYGITRLLESLMFTVPPTETVELLFAIDEDDLLSKSHIEIVIKEKKYPRVIIVPFYRPRSEFLNRDYYNWLASRATGKYLWVIGDDVVFQVVNWTTIILGHLNNYLQDKPDKIFCAGIKDTTPKPKPTLPQFPCFPLVSKEAFEAVGFVLHPNIPTWGADYLLYLLYTGAGRYLCINDNIYLHHIGVHTKTGPKDDTALRIEQTFNKLKMNPDHNIDRYAEFDIPKDVEKLREYIRRKNEGMVQAQ